MLPGPHTRRRHRRGTGAGERERQVAAVRRGDRPGHQHRVTRHLAAALVTFLTVVTLLACFHSGSTSPTTHQATAPRTPAATAPAQTVPDSVTRTTPTPRTASITLHSGDSLWALARTHHTTVHALQHLNHLGHSTLIYAGHQLLIPTPHSAPAPAPTAPSHTTTARTRQTSTAPRSTAADTRSATAIAFARRQLGTPYRWGGTGNGGYDCSGLVQAAWAASGVHLPRTTYAQAATGTGVTRGQLRPGDLVFTEGLGHVQLYVGDGRVIEAPHTGATVRYAALPPAPTVNAYRRVTPAPARTSTQARTSASATPAPHPGPATAPAHAPSGTPQQIAAAVFGPQYDCAARIITRESGWNPRAVNAGSGAYGLGQALPAAKMAPFGSDWATNPTTQLRWMRDYVQHRYGGACNAWAWWQTHHWY
jgi:cell wall-associated NlpC family hydrolase